MYWKKIDLTSEQIIIGELDKIMEKLLSITKTSGIPEGFGVFVGKKVNKITPLYFTPASIPYIQNILAEYNISSCEKPTKENIEAFFFGRNDT